MPGRRVITGVSGPASLPEAQTDSITAAHLGWLAQRGRSAATIYHRGRYLARLAAWLECYGEDRDCEGLADAGSHAVCVCSTPPRGFLLEATRADLLAWRATLHLLAPASVLAAVSHIREFYKWAADEDLIPASPATRIPVPRKPRGLPRPVGEDTLLRVLEEAPRRVRPWLVLAGWCGLRACEIAGLRAENIRPAELIVDAASAKGGRERVIPLSPWVAGELAGLPSRGFVFPRCDGLPGPLTAHAVSTAANRYLRRAGAGVTLHQLRHRALTQAWRGTRDLLAVAALAGHANVATTTIYTKLDDAAVQAAVAAIPVPARLRVVS